MTPEPAEPGARAPGSQSPTAPEPFAAPSPAATSPAPPASPRQAPGPAQGWRSLLVVYGIVSTIEAIGVSQVFAFLPLRLREVGLPEAQIPTFTGLFSSLIFVFGILLVPFWGVWADLYSRRAVIVRSAVVEAVVFAGVALAREPWQLAASLLLVGLQLGNTGVMLAALRDVTPRRRVGTTTALFGATGPLGFALGPVLGAVVVDGLGLPLVVVFWLGSALSLGSVALLLAGSREIRPAVVPKGRAIALARRAVGGVVADPAVRRIFAIFGVAILANQMSRPYVPLLVEVANGDAGNLASAIGLVAGTAALFGALISPLAGPLGDRVGFRPILGASALGAGAMLLLMPLAPGVAALAGVAVVYAALQAATQAMVFGLVAVEVAPERRSATLNLVLLPLYFAGIVGPAIGAVAAGIGGVAAPFYTAGAVFLGGGFAIIVALGRAARR